MLSANSLVQSNNSSNNNNNNNTPVTTIQKIKDDKQQQQKLDKSEINDAVSKVLQGYDWTLVPIATK